MNLYTYTGRWIDRQIYESMNMHEYLDILSSRVGVEWNDLCLARNSAGVTCEKWESLNKLNYFVMSVCMFVMCIACVSNCVLSLLCTICCVFPSVLLVVCFPVLCSLCFSCVYYPMYTILCITPWASRTVLSLVIPQVYYPLCNSQCTIDCVSPSIS